METLAGALFLAGIVALWPTFSTSGDGVNGSRGLIGFGLIAASIIVAFLAGWQASPTVSP